MGQHFNKNLYYHEKYSSKEHKGYSFIQSDFNEKNLSLFFKNLRSDKKCLINYRNKMLSGLANSNFTSFRPNLIIDYLEKFS